MQRRSFLKGILAAGMAPAVVKAGIIMPVKKIVTTQDKDFWRTIPSESETKAKLRALGISDSFLSGEPFQPAQEFTHHIKITQEDLLDDRYSNAVHELMVWEDQQYQKEFGRLMAEELKRASQRKGFIRRVLGQ